MRIYIFLLLFIFYFTFRSNCQITKPGFEIFVAGHPRELQDGFDTLLALNGYGWIPIIYENDIDPDVDGKLNVELFEKRIISFFPDSLQDGICVLNWESPVMDRLLNNSRHSEVYKDQCAEMIRALKIAKRLRPHVKWGYYGLNIQDYYTRGKEWKSKSKAFTPILNHADISFPSIYKFYPLSYHSRLFEFNYSYETVLYNLKIGRKLSKPVLPFIWPRFHDGDTTVGLKSIPDNEWNDHVEVLSKTKFKNKSIDGFVVWSMDVYFIGVSPMVKSEIGKENSETYRQRNLLHYLNMTRDISNKQ